MYWSDWILIFRLIVIRASNPGKSRSQIKRGVKFAEMPSNCNWITLYGVGVLTGIGFTMSLFVGNLAFADATQHLDGVKIGVLLGSLASTVFGYTIILLNKKK